MTPVPTATLVSALVAYTVTLVVIGLAVYVADRATKRHHRRTHP